MSLFSVTHITSPNNFVTILSDLAEQYGCTFADNVWTFPSGKSVSTSIPFGTANSTFLLVANTKAGNEAFLLTKSSSSGTDLISTVQSGVFAGQSDDGFFVSENFSSIAQVAAFCTYTNSKYLSANPVIYPCVVPSEAKTIKNIFLGYGSAVYKSILRYGSLEVVAAANIPNVNYSVPFFIVKDDEMFD